MKKCPVCDKTFEDSMRFCQTDGTPLVDEVPVDPYKTVVAGKDEISSAIPSLPEDPFKTMVAGAQPKGLGDDLLEIPEEEDFDPMKTMVTPQSSSAGSSSFGQQDESAGKPKEEIKVKPIADEPSSSPSSSASPFDNVATPSQPRSEDKADIFSSPPTPKFNEPSLSPPSFSDMASSGAPNSGYSSSPFNDSSNSDTNDQTVMYPSSPLPPLSKESSEPPPTMLGESPFGNPNNAPIPSPFGDMPKSSYDMPSTPPLQSYKEPEPPSFGNQSNNPFNQPSFNQGENINQNMQQQDWNPPPAPDASWQNQGVGQNTPFQPPPTGGGGLNQTLPIISLVLGIVSICCYISPLTGIAALITGFLGMKNANNDPSQFGGKGLAIAGMITGGIFLVLGIVYYILIFLGVAMGSMNRF